MKKQVQITVHTIDGKTFHSKGMNEQDETTQETIEAIKHIKSLDFFWMVDYKNDVVSFNNAHISAIRVEKVKRFKLF